MVLNYFLKDQITSKCDKAISIVHRNKMWWQDSENQWSNPFLKMRDFSFCVKNDLSFLI